MYILIITCLTAPYIVLLVVLTAGVVSTQRKVVRNNGASIGISVVIAARNEEQNIEKVVISLLNQDYPTQCFEIVVVDDHSDDATASQIPISPLVKRVSLPETIFGKKAALRAGVAVAEFPYVAFIDADCTAPNTWLKTLASIIADKNPALIVGPVGLQHENSALSSFQEWEFRALQMVTFGCAAVGFPTLCNGANLCFKKEDYNHVNLKEKKTPSGDDIFLLHSLLKQKKTVAFSYYRELLVTTNAQRNLKGMLQQKLRWASKSKYVTNPTTLIVGAITAAANFAIVGCTLYAATVREGMYLAAAVYFAKVLAEGFLVYIPSKKVYGARPSVHTFIISALLMPFYATFVALASLFLNFTWKQRTQR